MRLGIGSYTFTWAIGVPKYPARDPSLTVEGLLEKAEELGVSLVQVCDNLPLHELPPGRLAVLAARARETGITLEAGTRGTDPDHLLRYLSIALSLGAPLVRTLIGTAEESSSLQLAETRLRAIAPRFEREGVALAIENYEQYPARDLAGLIDRVASPSVGVCLDTVNSLGALEPPDEVINVLLPHALNIHVKDFDIVRADHRMGFAVIGTPAGQGRLEIADLLARARAGGRDPSVVLELWTPFKGSIESTVALEREWAATSIRYLRELISE
jgi:sugar phosphate isomerase/epimerase